MAFFFQPEESYFYVNQAGVEAGPEPISKLRTLWNAKEIDGSTLLWKENMLNWAAINDLPIIKSKLRPPPPPSAQAGSLASPLSLSSSLPTIPSKATTKGPKKKTVVSHNLATATPRSAAIDEMVMTTSTSTSSTPLPPNPSTSTPVPPPPPSSAAAFSFKTKVAERLSSKHVSINSTAKVNNEEATVQAPMKLPKKGPGGGGRGGPSLTAQWIEKKTVDNALYYYQPETSAVSWDKPDSLKSETEKEGDSGKWVWVRGEEGEWLPGRLMGEEMMEVTAVLMNGKKMKVKKGADQPLWSLKPSSLKHLEEDLVMLDDLNEAIMMHCLRERYLKGEIYTWVGANHSVLVSVNPFKQLPIYTISVMQEFAKPRPNKLLPPHTFALANTAYLQMRMEAQNQAILISGESGAGKTESTKQCLTYLAEIAGSDTSVEQRILSANPILETFGNSKTLRNNNSSRFGKWSEVHFNVHGKIVGARIENYLLEKSRVVHQTYLLEKSQVVHQAKDERNYHIFYQLCHSKRFASGAAALGLNNKKPEDFRYLRMSGCTKVAGIDDEQDFDELKAALNQLGFNDEEQGWIFNLVAGILHLGNISFLSDASGEGSVIDPETADFLRNAAGLLRVDSSILATALCRRSIEVRGELNHILLKPSEATDAADALAKSIYAKLFDWIVGRINQSIQRTEEGQEAEQQQRGQEGEGGHSSSTNDGTSNTNFIGILDIMGFEIFKTNSFEQFNINFANEKLQQHFNKHTFMEEESVYVEEGIPFTRVPFIDNQPVLDLIEKKPFGLLPLLDEEIRLPQGSDSKWLSKCDAKHASDTAWGRSAANTKLQSEVSVFTIKHYAGAVGYESSGFVEKNRDFVAKDLYTVMALSTDRFNQALFPPQDKAVAARTKLLTLTLAGQFRAQLTTLMETVDKTQPHYIRCIKPNSRKVPQTFEVKVCTEQLTYAGVFEAVQIRKSGYPFRYPHHRFVARYRCILYEKSCGNGSSKQQASSSSSWFSNSSNDQRAACAYILASLTHQNFSAVQLGNSMVLYRAEEHRILELLRNLALERILPVTQRAGRRMVGRRYQKALQKTKEVMKIGLEQGNDIDLIEKSLAEASAILGPFASVFPDYTPTEVEKGRELVFKLKERRELTVLLSALVELDVNEHYMELGAAIVRADAIKDIPGTAAQMEVEARCRGMLEECAGARLDPIANDALWHLDKAKMTEVSQEAAKVGYVSNDLVEIREKLTLPEEEFVKLQLKRANELQDPERIINREVRLKEIFLASNYLTFALEKCPLLQDPIYWASQKRYGLMRQKEKEALIEGFLYHSSHSIHTPLTILSNPVLQKEAIKQFKHIMGYMGDRKGQYIDTYAQDMLAKGLSEPELRGELYMQVMKQLRRNKADHSREQGWALMVLLLSCFPPPSTLESYLAVFLRHEAPAERAEQLLAAMYAITYAGARRTPIPVEELPVLVANFYHNSISCRYTSEDIVRVRRVTIPENEAPSGHEESKREEQQQQHIEEREEGGLAFTRPFSASHRMVTPSSMGIPPPPPSPPAPKLHARALYDLDPPAGRGDVLGLRAGEEMMIVERTNDEWWLALKGGQEGWVPANYVQIV